MATRQWRVSLGAAAEIDFAQILAWTVENFVAQQAAIYRDILVEAISELVKGPDVPGARTRDDILPGVRALHVARHGRRGRHFLLYRVIGEDIIEVGRILHDQMDLQRHWPPSSSEDGEA